LRNKKEIGGNIGNHSRAVRLSEDIRLAKRGNRGQYRPGSPPGTFRRYSPFGQLIRSGWVPEYNSLR
jgi:hypothetical protein